MKQAFNTLLTVLQFVAVGGFAFLIAGLGYIYMAFGLNFGWIAVVGLIALIFIMGMIEGGLMAIVLSPFNLFKAIRSGGNPPPEPSVAERTTTALLRNGVLTCIAVGALVAVIQHLLTGGLS